MFTNTTLIRIGGVLKLIPAAGCPIRMDLRKAFGTIMVRSVVVIGDTEIVGYGLDQESSLAQLSDNVRKVMALR